MINSIVAVGIVALAMLFLAPTVAQAADLTGKTPLIVTVAGSGGQSITTGKGFAGS